MTTVAEVFVASLDRPPAAVERLARTLAPDEREHARRLRFARDRLRFLASRGLRRAILARSCGSDPARLEFVRGAGGKPELAGSGPSFSVSHSGGLALYAICADGRVGVDVEYLRPVPDGMEIARTLFHAMEYRAFAALPERDRPRAFFDCWTRKEAYLKARGSGLAAPLDRFAVTLSPNEPARLEHVDGDRHEAAGWSLAAFEPNAGFVAAVAVEGPGRAIACRWWR